MINFITVLKSGKFFNGTDWVEYQPWMVLAIRDQVRRHYQGDHEFYCLTDMPIPGVKTIPLKHDWPGWWSKMEIFRPDLPRGQYFYLDLDVVIVGDLTNLVDEIDHFRFVPEFRNQEGFHGSVYSFSKPMDQYILNPFLKDAKGNMQKFRSDQEYISSLFRSGSLHSTFPQGKILSYKFDLEDKHKIPDSARIICFHGLPKPWDIKPKWLPNYDH